MSPLSALCLMTQFAGFGFHCILFHLNDLSCVTRLRAVNSHVYECDSRYVRILEPCPVKGIRSCCSVKDGRSLSVDHFQFLLNLLIKDVDFIVLLSLGEDLLYQGKIYLIHPLVSGLINVMLMKLTSSFTTVL